MKILYYYPEHKNDFMFFWQRVHFLDELSRGGVEIEVLNPLEYESLEESHSALLKKLSEGSFDLFLVSASLFVNRELLANIKKLGVPSLCFRPDNLLIPYIDKEIASSFDLVWLTSKETEHLYKKWGANYIFLPYAANPHTFQPEFASTINKVCFIGTPYGSRSNMINTLVNHGVEIDVYCKNSGIKKKEVIVPKYKEPAMSTLDVLLNNIKYKEGRKVLFANLINRLQKHDLNEESNCISLLPKVPFDDLNKLYSNYSLSLSSTSARNTDVLTHPVKVVNLRAFEIPMAGGLQFCRYSEELAGYFEEDKEIVFYRSNEELAEKAKFYTNPKNDDTTCKMKQAARKRAEAEHTWTARFNMAFKVLGLK